MFVKFTAASILAAIAVGDHIEPEEEWNWEKNHANEVPYFWNYKRDAEGKQDWQGTCATGKKQSPIDLNKQGSDTSSHIKVEGFNYGYSKMDVANYSYGIAGTLGFEMDNLDDAARLEMTFASKTTTNYYPRLVSFHSPSEHTVGGWHYDLEMQITHSHADGSLGAIVSIFFDTERSTNGGYRSGEKNDWLRAIDWNHVTMNAAETDWNFRSLAGVDMRNFWSYDGSLTVPPCTEGVKWIVVEEVQNMSVEQLLSIQQHHAMNPMFSENRNQESMDDWVGNNRAVQPLNEEGAAEGEGRKLWFTDRSTAMMDMWKVEVEETGATSLIVSAAVATLLNLF